MKVMGLVPTFITAPPEIYDLFGCDLLSFGRDVASILTVSETCPRRR